MRWGRRSQQPEEPGRPADLPPAGAPAYAFVVAALEHERAGRRDLAAACFEQAAAQGHAVSMEHLGRLAEEDARADEAREWYERSVAAGNSSAALSRDLLASRTGRAVGAGLESGDDEEDVEEAEARELRAAAEAGDPAAMLELAEELRESRRYDDARAWLERAAEGGSREARRELADLLPDDDPRKDRLWREEGAEGDRDGLRLLADHLVETGRFQEAAEVWQRLADQGDAWAQFHAGSALERSGAPDRAIAAFRVAMRAPSTRVNAAQAYGALMVGGARDEDPAEGEQLLRKAGRSGGYYVGWLLESRGDLIGAEAAYAEAAHRGMNVTEASLAVARLLDGRGEGAAAAHWRTFAGAQEGSEPAAPAGDEAELTAQERRARQGDPWGWVRLGELHEEAGRLDRARAAWEQGLARPGDIAGVFHGRLGALVVEHGPHDEGSLRAAEEHLRQARGQNQLHLAWLLEQRGDVAEAEQIYADWAEDDDQYGAMAGLARLLARRGETGAARPWREMAEAGGVAPEGPPW